MKYLNMQKGSMRIPKRIIGSVLAIQGICYLTNNLKSEGIIFWIFNITLFSGAYFLIFTGRRKQ